MKHFMVDIETMSSADNAAIIAIGVAEFKPFTGEIGETLEVRCTLEAMRDLGRNFSPETVEWWLNQSKEAQKQLLMEPRFKEALPMATKLHEFMVGLEPSQWKRATWAKGPGFDLKLVRHLCDQLEVTCPWHFSREFCVRTMLMIAKANGWNDILSMKADVEHGALSDAIHQAEQVMAVMARLKQ